jgi:dipeptidyl aminopeptidase/acylaminoacyl peptidase
MLHAIAAGLALAAPVFADPPEELLSVAERSNWTATARHEDVLTLCRKLDEASDLVVMGELGRSGEDRPIPMLIVADPPLSTPEEARRSGKLVVLLIGNIHAGEVEGKEALPMLVRDIVLADPEAPPRTLLRDLVLVVVPNYNPDGNENLGPVAQKRPGQNGPGGGDGVGARENSKGLDLNRDYVKAEAPETRALLRAFRRWDPQLFIDTHTTNGSHHRYTITYMGPTNPAGDPAILDFVRSKLLPGVGATLKERTGYESFFYGNLEGRGPEGQYSKWTTYPDLPRYGGPYVGLRNRLSVLSEAYSYAPYKDRVLATREFCRATLEFASANKDEIRRLTREADGAARKGVEKIHLRTEAKAFPDGVDVLGFVEEMREGRLTATEQATTHRVQLINDFAPTDSVTRARAYVYPRELTRITEMLQIHGVVVEELREDVDLDLEVYRIDTVTKAMRPFQGHDLLDVGVTAQTKTDRVKAGAMVVRTSQALGVLASYLLEPHAADGLTAWNFFDEHLAVGGDFPVARLVSDAPILTCETRPLAEDREMGKRITYQALYQSDGPAPQRGQRGGRGGGGSGGGGVNLGASAASGFRWLEDGEHYAIARDGKNWRVDARTGRAEVIAAEDRSKLAEALATLPSIPKDRANGMANGGLNTNPARTGALFAYENDLYYAALDGSAARRLTSTPEAEEDVTWSPDGAFVAFTRAFDLYVADVGTGTERRLTTGGNETLRHGKNDWVYFEEIFNRSWRAYWWSPDSRRIAFLEVDSSKVPLWTLPADHENPRRIEQERYPRPGDPNPTARVGVVTVAGGDVRWADLGGYDAGGYLVTQVGWLAPKAKAGKDAPEAAAAYCCVQNRTQTWMDVLAVNVSNGSTRKLMREQTEAWVEPQGEPYVLEDGSFIWASERTGYRHLYHYAPDGKLKGAITSGAWEARSIAHVDAEKGEVIFSGTERSPIGSHLYAVKLDGSGMRPLTPSPVGPVGEPPLGARADSPGTHSASVSPTGAFFIDSWSDLRTPTRVGLFDREGNLVRMLDTNPAYGVEEYERGTLERHTIQLPDGFQLEATVLKPPGFSESNKYPVWLMTYAGPHAPTVSDSWGGGRAYDEMLAEMGIVVFRVDPRSASGKGAVSAWSAYKRLGVQELKDLEGAVAWLAERPWIDASRVGIAGGSYGGFMTSYALTHSKAFSCGIATAAVTDWRDYDSIYTERYMLTPQENPEGYAQTSVVEGAEGLHGRLLLIHGTMDDNVHVANSIKLVSALQRAGKQFDFMLYPGARHGVGGEHVRQMSYDFIREHLLGGGAAPERPASDRPARRGGRRERGTGG